MKSFFPSTNQNLINNSDSNDLEKKNCYIDNFHSIIDYAKNTVNDIYNENPYLKYCKSSERNITKKLKIIYSIKPKKKFTLIKQTLFTNRKFLIRNYSLINIQ